MNLGPSFAHVLWQRAQDTPDRIAIGFRDGSGDLTYGDLHHRAAVLATRLRRRARRGDRALLLLPPGPDYVTAFFGCLYAGVIAVPTYPPLDERQLPRLVSVMADAEPSVVITQAGLIDLGRDGLARHGLTTSAYWLATDEGTGEPPTSTPPAGRADDVAFLQYTSGSTSTPKGTIVTHSNLLDNSAAIRTLFGHTRDSVGVIWLPPYHDMGLIGGILQPVYAGFPVVLMSPLDFLADPRAWLAAITEHRATTSGGPNFAFDLCVRKIPPERREGLDLSSWSVAFCGAEPVRRDTMDRFAAAFGPYGFARETVYPCYGLAESTLIATGGVKGAGVRLDAGGAVSCGTAIPGHVVRTLPPGGTTPLPDGEVGEICVRGPSVAQGYWNDPDGTAATFPPDAGGQRLLRTGDLGFLRDGELYVTGRLKDVVIVRGRNLQAEDVEHALAGGLPAVQAGRVAAFELEVEREPALAVVIELTSGDPAVLDGLAAEVQRTLVATFGVRAERLVFTRRGAIPKTPSGKIRRSECRHRYLTGTLTPLTTTPAAPTPLDTDAAARAERAARAELAAELAALAAVVVGVSGPIPPDRPLTSAGLDSLRAVELRHAAQERLKLELPLRDLLAGATADELATAVARDALVGRDAAVVHAATGRPDAAVDRAVTGALAESGARPPEAADSGALSEGERGLWLAARLSHDPDHYVLSMALDLTHPVDPALLKESFDLLSARHPALRTHFPEVLGRPERTPLPYGLTLDVLDLGDVTPGELDRVVQERAKGGLDPMAGPLWRATLVRGTAAPEGGVLVLCAHHLVCDGWSLDLLARELGECYELLARGERPGWPPAGDPADAAAGQARLLSGDHGRELAAFWHDTLHDLPPSAALPQAHRHPTPSAPMPTAPTAQHRVRLDGELAGRLLDLARQEGVTLYTAMLAGLAWTLYRYTGERRFLLGMPASGRLDPGTASAVGYFVNPLPLVCEIDPDDDFRAHLRRLADAVAAGQAGQEYPYQRILEECVPAERAADLIRIMVTQQQAPNGLAPSLLDGSPEARRMGGLEARLRFAAQLTAPFELTVEIVATPQGLTWSFVHDTGALDAADVRAFARHWERTLAAAVAAPRLRPDEVDLLEPGERDLLLREWNAAMADVDGPPTVHEAVLAAGRTDAVAVRDEHGTLTYGELDRRGAALAAALVAHGAGGERPVALLLPRSSGLVVAMMAAMRAGSPYLPLDVEHPDARLAAILDDARPAVVLTSPDLAARPALRGRTVLVEDAAAGGECPSAPGHPDGLAYLIYTSGSTGTPKGVACAHRGVLNLAADFRARAGVEARDRCAWWTSPGFDVSVHEVFTALTAGATVEVCPPYARHDAGALADWLAEREITGAYLPPHLLPDLAAHLERQGARVRLRWLLVGVEPIPEPLLRRLVRLVPGLTVVNGYGPTECTVCATFHVVDPAGAEPGSTPLGGPVRNCPVYVLDGFLRPVPIGAVGEVYVAGPGLARGYHGSPGLTAERFVPSPFAPGERLYRTGDLARHRRDGVLLFAGRADRQAKIRGVRVEPGEIEAAMAGHPAVIAAVVETGGARLIGYARVAPGRVEEPGLAADVTRYLRGLLPGPMVPARVVLLDEWPTTVNGKIDRARLPRPAPTEYAAPAGTTEAAIARVWSRLLGVPRVGRTDDFFELGGHSLAAMRIAAELAGLMARPVDALHVLDHPTVAELAVVLDGLPEDPDTGPDAALTGSALLDHVAALPAEALDLLRLEMEEDR
ncbi:amino acid adenylation domain-containing protein [Nonomuraea spiralis]|uniref:amino acid adenylation domain-containing protein n=1 Tax=Nonomuraea spiralis TaxID=46182 RepID=UPI0037A43244